MRPLIVIRADAGPRIGGGHVMRCMALAEKLIAANWDVAFAVRSPTLAAVPSLASAAVSIISLDGSSPDAEAEFIRIACPRPVAAVIVDHYGRDAQFEKGCRRFTRMVVAIDDVPNSRQHAVDILIDGTPGHAEQDWRACTPLSATVLAGENYALIRQAITSQRQKSLLNRNACRAVKNIVVAFGLSDSRNATLPALRAARSAFPESNIEVIVGPAFESFTQVSREADELKCSVHVAPANYVEKCAMADLAIGAGGVSALERACLGLPSVVVQLAENQHRGIIELLRRRAIIFAGDVGELAHGWPPEILKSASSRLGELSCNAAAICDGNGVKRVAHAIHQLLRQRVARL